MANFGILQGIQPGQIVGQIAPSAGGGDDMGGILSGLKSLFGGISGAMGGSGPTQGPSAASGPTSYVNQSGTYGSNYNNPTLQQQAVMNTQPQIQSPGMPPSISLNNSLQTSGSYGSQYNKPTLQQQALNSQMPKIGQPKMPGELNFSNSSNQQQGLLGNMPVTQYQELSKRPAFQEAFKAQQRAWQSGVTKSPVMTVVDYSLPANQQRLWTVDTKKNQVLLSSYVAHGAGSGRGAVPTSFSNKEGSHATSLGTYLTQNPYQGKHGTSLRLQGLDPTNNNAFKRAVVVHGGNYIGPDKTGTSWGCFTVPNEVAPKLVGLTQKGTIIHAYAPNQSSMKQFSQSLPAATRSKLNSSYMNPELEAVKAGIAHVESSGSKNPYLVQSKPTKGDRGYGKYQIMGKNIPTWTREATGRAYTPEEFLQNPDIQEQTASYHINRNLNTYGNRDDAFSVWFSGRPAKKAGNAKDVYGTTVPQYLRKANQGYLQYQNSQGSQQASQSNTPTFQKVSLDSRDQGLVPTYPDAPTPVAGPKYPMSPGASLQGGSPITVANNSSSSEESTQGVNWGLLSSLLQQNANPVG